MSKIYKKRYIYEVYVFSINGEVPTLLDICMEQKKENPANAEQCAILIAEFIAGISKPATEKQNKDLVGNIETSPRGIILLGLLNLRVGLICFLNR